MSKDYCGFENETGETGFLAGIVDVLSDNLGMILDYSYALDADIFYVKDNDISLLNDSVKKRLHDYKQKYGLTVPEEKIDILDFQLKEINTDVYNFICSQMKKYSSNDRLSDEVSNFLNDLNWYLQKPVCIYAPETMPDKNIDTLGRIYLYMAWNYFFISYYDYFVLLVFGTVE